MSQPLEVKNDITIDAPAEKVWDALVNPEQTKKYMFGCAAISDWKPGDSLIWKGNFDGQELVAVKGNVVSIIPGSHLAYTVIDPNNLSIEDKPENYLTVAYNIKEQEGKSLLTVSQGDFSKVADGEKRYKETYNNGEGWMPILVQIKAIAESAS